MEQQVLPGEAGRAQKLHSLPSNLAKDFTTSASAEFGNGPHEMLETIPSQTPLLPAISSQNCTDDEPETVNSDGIHVEQPETSEDEDSPPAKKQKLSEGPHLSENTPGFQSQGMEIIDITGDHDKIVETKEKKKSDDLIYLGKIVDVQALADIVPQTPSQDFWEKSGAFNVEPRHDPRVNRKVMALIDIAGRQFARMDPLNGTPLANITSKRVFNEKIRIRAKLNISSTPRNLFPGDPIHICWAATLFIRARESIAREFEVFLKCSNIRLVKPLPLNGPATTSMTALRASAVQSVAGPAALPDQPMIEFELKAPPKTIEETEEEVKEMVNLLITRTLKEMQPNWRVKSSLFPHQKEALWFMHERETTSLKVDDPSSFYIWKRVTLDNGFEGYMNVLTNELISDSPPPPFQGGILADEMGLGKTLSCLALICSTIDEAEEFSKYRPTSGLQLNSKTTLLVVPLSTSSNWQMQIEGHLDQSVSFYIYHGPKREKNARKLTKYDIVITTYDIVQREWRQKDSPLFLTNFFRIVLDEAHYIRGQNSRHRAACDISAVRRWGLTGTPFFNRMDDFGALVAFLGVPLSRSDPLRHFKKHFIQLFKDRETDSLCRFKLLWGPLTLRREKNSIMDLPERTFKHVRLNLSPADQEIYDFFNDDGYRKVQILNTPGTKATAKALAEAFKSLLSCRQIACHGIDLLSESERRKLDGMTTASAIEISDDDDDDDHSVRVSQSGPGALTKHHAHEIFYLWCECGMLQCSECEDDIEMTEDDDADETTYGYVNGNSYLLCHICGANKPNCVPVISSDWNLYLEAKQMMRSSKRTWKQVGATYSGPSVKVQHLITQLKRLEAESAANPNKMPNKSVIFSCWTGFLDLIELAFVHHNIRNHTRVDGSKSRKDREKAINAFQTDPNICIFLITIGSGAVGLNLTAANTVFLMEPQWSPMQEMQALDRVHRIGQTREVTIYKYIMNKTVEKSILKTQNKKKILAELSLDQNKLPMSAEETEKKLMRLSTLFRKRKVGDESDFSESESEDEDDSDHEENPDDNESTSDGEKCGSSEAIGRKVIDITDDEENEKAKERGQCDDDDIMAEINEEENVGA